MYDVFWVRSAAEQDGDGWWALQGQQNARNPWKITKKTTKIMKTTKNHGFSKNVRAAYAPARHVYDDRNAFPGRIKHDWRVEKSWNECGSLGRHPTVPTPLPGQQIAWNLAQLRPAGSPTPDRLKIWKIKRNRKNQVFFDFFKVVQECFP